MTAGGPELGWLPLLTIQWILTPEAGIVGDVQENGIGSDGRNGHVLSGLGSFPVSKPLPHLDGLESNTMAFDKDAAGSLRSHEAKKQVLAALA